MIKALSNLGDYILLMKRTFAIPEKWNIFFKQIVTEVFKLVIDSIGIVIFISLFIGAVITMQIELNINSPMIPEFTTGFVTREILLLEFSSTIMCLILAGKVGSNISSELGTMRVTEQVDALEIMGVNSANYLILPKVVAFVGFIPILVVLSIFFGLFGGFILSWATDIITPAKFEFGIQYWFSSTYLWYVFVKTMVFAFVISSVSSYWGYNVKGGALAVGKASTNSVVSCNVLILFLDLVLTQLLLS
jgi:ABC-type transport system involved in resistance to organic solvents, permease component